MTPLDLFNEHKALASNIGRKWSRDKKSPTHITPEDASQIALEALWRAAKSFDETRGVEFVKFALGNIRYALLDTWKSSPGGRLLAGIHSPQDTQEAGMVYSASDLEERDDTDMVTENHEDQIDACIDYGRVIKLLPEDAKQIIERAVSRDTPAIEKPLVDVIKANLKEASKSNLDAATIARKLKDVHKPGFAKEAFKHVEPIEDINQRQQAVKQATEKYTQQTIASLFGVSRPSVSMYASGQIKPSAELAGACMSLATGNMSVEEIATTQWPKENI